MKYLLRAEESAQLILAILAIYLQPVHVAGWLWPILFLSPDLSMVGYVISPKAGARTYNLFHHKGVAGGAILAGYFMHVPLLLLAGLVLFAHSSFDRMLGYGLKHEDGFGHTHLGMIGKVSEIGQP